MPNQDQQRLNLEGLIKKLRSVTIAVQVMPFIYTAIYIVCMVLYFFADESNLVVLDTMFYVSPSVSAEFLVLSKILRLCRWHKLTCALPIFPQVLVLLDHTAVYFSLIAARLAIITTMAMAVLLLYAAYRVFLKPKHNGRKEVFNRNA